MSRDPDPTPDGRPASYEGSAQFRFVKNCVIKDKLYSAPGYEKIGPVKYRKSINHRRLYAYCLLEGK
jgi:hypothetical protein